MTQIHKRLLLLSACLLFSANKVQANSDVPMVLQVTGDAYFYNWDEDAFGSGTGNTYGGTVRLSGIGAAGYSIHFSMRGGQMSAPGGLQDSDLREIDAGIIGPITDHLFWSLGYYYISNEGEFQGLGGVGTFDASTHAIPIGLIAAYPLDITEKFSITPRLGLAIGPGFYSEEGEFGGGGGNYDSSGVSFLLQTEAQVTFEYKLTSQFSLHADGGYRYMQVGDTELHGPFVRAGFRIAF
jgi:hypothetical protein